jgi:uncharacterized membrane protein
MLPCLVVIRPSFPRESTPPIFPTDRNGGGAMGDDRMVTLFVGAYDDVADGLADLEHLKDLRRDDRIGAYEAALVKKEPSGEVVVANVDSSARRKAAGAGAVAGGVLGVIFPPSAVGMAVVGALGGAAAGGHGRKLKRSDYKELGGLLREGRSGLVVVTDEAPGSETPELLSRAVRTWHGPVYADADAIKEAVADVAVAEHVRTLG